MSIPVLAVALGQDGVWEIIDTDITSPEDIATVESLEHFSAARAQVRVRGKLLELTVYKASRDDGYVVLGEIPNA